MATQLILPGYVKKHGPIASLAERRMEMYKYSISGDVQNFGEGIK